MTDRRRRHPSLQQTEKLVRHYMAGLVDKAGRALADHCARVVESVPPEESDDVRHAAWLHDVIEDTKLEIEDLIVMGYSAEVIRAVELLTHDNPDVMPYAAYIARLLKSGNRAAIMVKWLDNRDNAAEWRMEGLEPKLRKWLEERYSGVEPALREALAACDG